MKKKEKELKQFYCNYFVNRTIGIEYSLIEYAEQIDTKL